MNVWRRLARPRVVPLTADTPDGAYVELTGITHALPNVETIVPPICGQECVVARVRFDLQGQGRGTQKTQFERFHNRPFVVESGPLRVIVDSAHIELHVVTRTEASTTELCVPTGARVTVRGTLMRDGATRPDEVVGFRDSPPVFTLVGSQDRPVIISRSR